VIAVLFTILLSLVQAFPKAIAIGETPHFFQVQVAPVFLVYSRYFKSSLVKNHSNLQSIN
jgi:hypothetical protein